MSSIYMLNGFTILYHGFRQVPDICGTFVQVRGFYGLFLDNLWPGLLEEGNTLFEVFYRQV